MIIPDIKVVYYRKINILKGFIIALIIFLFFPGCQAKSVFLKPFPAEGSDRGEVFLYTQPFPQEADRLVFNIKEIFAMKDDGMAIPLFISLAEFKCRDIKRQRLVATGDMPPGYYTGLSFKVRDASLEVEEGVASLLVPDEPVKIDFPFQISTGKSNVISLSFNYIQSIKNRFKFSPSFSIFIPGKPLAGLTGYVTNYASDNLMVFDKKAMQVVGVIATGRGPNGIALNQRLRRAYVALSSDDAIDVIDVTAEEVINRIRLNTGDNPQEPALTPDGRLLLTANSGSNTVSVIDPIGFIELSRINVGNSPNSILIDPAGRRAYVFNTLSNTISVIDIANKSIAATISTEPGPLRGQFNRQGDKLYVIHELSSYLAVINPLSLTVTNKIYVGMGMRVIKLDTKTNMFYMSKKHGSMVEVYDPLSSIPIDYIKTDGDTAYITIDGEENNLYLTIPETKTLMIVNTVSKKIVSKIDVGESPYWVTMMGER